MADKAWKRYERRVAKYIGHAERVPITGRQRGSAPDIEHPWLAIECKYRGGGKGEKGLGLPKWIKDAMSQAKASARTCQAPVVIMGEAGEETGKSWILMELNEFRDRFL